MATARPTRYGEGRSVRSTDIDEQLLIFGDEVGIAHLRIDAPQFVRAGGIAVEAVGQQMEIAGQPGGAYGQRRTGIEGGLGQLPTWPRL